jgi:hypothetical protein
VIADNNRKGFIIMSPKTFQTMQWLAAQYCFAFTTRGKPSPPSHEDMRAQFIENALWESIAIDAELPECFMEEFSNELNWYLISQYQNFGTEFVRRNAARLDMRVVMSRNDAFFAAVKVA